MISKNDFIIRTGINNSKTATRYLSIVIFLIEVQLNILPFARQAVTSY